MPRKCAVCRKPSSAFLCDNPACREAHNARCREYNRQKRAEHAARGESYRNRWTKGRERKTGASCTNCGEPTRGGQGAETKCRACHHPRQSRRDRALGKLAKAALGERGRRKWVCGRCMRCGSWFTGQPARWCSAKCKRQDKAATRRALEAGVKITPGRRYAVYERDSWTCRICGDPVNRDAQVPELDAPTIDHIVPLARGGAHAPENWQTAHFYCNSDKRDQLGFEFAEEEEPWTGSQSTSATEAPPSGTP